MINLNWYAWQNTIRSMADSVNKKLVFEEGLDRPRTDYTTVYVQKPEANWSEHQFKRWAGEICHEIGHIRGGMEKYKDVAEQNKIVNGTLPGILFNIVEDYDNEKNELGLFKGKDALVEYCRECINKEGIGKLGKSADKERNLLEGVNTYFQTIRDWQPSVPIVAKDVVASLNKKGLQYYEKMEELDLKEELDSYRADPEKSWDIVKRIMDHLGLDTKKEIEEMEKLHTEITKDTKEGEKAAGSNKKIKGSTDEEGKEEGKEVSVKAGKVKYKDLLQGSGNLDTGTGLQIDYEEEDLKGNQYAPSTVEEMVIRDWAKNPSVPPIDVTFNETAAELLANKFRRLLQINTRKRIEYNKTKGKLSTKSLYKVAAPIETSNQWEKIFKHKTAKFTLDTAVTVLLDSSGSMSGEKWEHASYGLVLLHRMLRTLGVAHELISFTEGSVDPNRDSQVINHIIKGFSDTVPEYKIKHILGNIRYEMGCNNDLDSILYAYNRLRQHKAKRKLLIILSDGQPASMRKGAYEMPGKLKEVIDELYKRKEIEIYSIGIMSDAVKWFYKKYKVIESVGQLEEALLTIVSTNIIHEVN